MLSLLLVIALLFPTACWTDEVDTCESVVPPTIDRSICDDIRSTIFIFRYAVRDIDAKVKETVLTSLNEAQKILDSTMTTTIEDVRGMFSGSRRKRSTQDMSGEVHALAEAAVKNIHEAVIVAEKKIRSSITLAVLNTDIQNNKIKTEALSILRKVLSKRSLDDESQNGGTSNAVQRALSAASVEVKNAMKDAVSKSIEEYRKIMDYFASRLKELFAKANFKGNVDQAEQDIEDLAIKTSVLFIQYYESNTTVAIRRAIKSVEGLMSKFNNMGKDNPYVLMMAKMLLEAAGMHVAEVVTETKEEEADGEIKKKIIADAEKMLKDYQTIEGILKKHGV